MNTSDLLEQLLRAGQAGASRQGGADMASQDPLGGLGGLLGGLMGGGGGNAGLGGLLGSILGGGGGLGGNPMGGGSMGSSGGRSGGMNYAALASLGMMAFQAYQAWQRQQPAAAPQQALRTVDQLSGADADDHSLAILRALIAAAKADGRIDEQEKQTIYAEIARHTDDPQLQEWLDQEVRRPLDAAEVAQSATDPGMAAEMYLASVMLVDDQQAAERAYLDELAYQLRLDPDLQAQLERQTRGSA
ncbi:tellurite resistance TerB family protein [Pseudomonas sp. BN415]|uniref:tellurite resistance TerB family protein n=1 Tax=Pseudomonas sp. BN415 TaxID=2567889 RepID=UPI002457AFC8|nr:tellurite resistance TerB family protein [Pseudomonas sp. BN415]MDH4582738.1 tellurite resistance TerB family protein [Pseudomonas sp. BN415]